MPTGIPKAQPVGYGPKPGGGYGPIYRNNSAILPWAAIQPSTPQAPKPATQAKPTITPAAIEPAGAPTVLGAATTAKRKPKAGTLNTQSLLGTAADTNKDLLGD